MQSKMKRILGLILTLVLLEAIAVEASFDITALIDNIEDRNDQTVFIGEIDTLVINRGGAEFILGPGMITIFNFGSGRNLAMLYEGLGHFIFNPPNEVERYQLKKFTKQDSIYGEFKSICFFFNTVTDFLPETTELALKIVDKGTWRKIRKIYKDAFEYGNINLVNFLLPEIILENNGFNFYADLKIEKIGHLAFIESPYFDDYYSIMNFKRKMGYKYADVLSGWSDDDLQPVQRGVFAIDVTHYEIESIIEDNGDMKTSCRIFYNPLRGGTKFLYFNWYYKNSVISATDSNGDTLFYTGQKDEDGFALILNEPLELGKSDYIDIDFKCGAIDNLWGIFYIKEQAFWYPQYDLNDRATYKLTFDCPKYFEVLASGNRIESAIENKRRTSKWVVNTPSVFVSFNVGKFDSKTVSFEGLPTVVSHLAENIPHREMALYLAATEGTLSSKDMIGNVAADVTNSLNYFTNLFGPCPYDTIRATEIPYNMGQSSPGFLLLSWGSYQSESLTGASEMFRAHEVAHQWWGNQVGWGNYRDYWIIEALAEYCGFWFYEMSVKDKKKCRNILREYRKNIISGYGKYSEGTKAGPLAIGKRLNSTKSDDYVTIVYEKGGYIFHMIRYILHDYKTGSDDNFMNFLKGLFQKFKGKRISNALLQKHLEEFTGEDVGWFFDQWIYSTAIPEYEFSYATKETEDGKYAITCDIKQKKVPDDFQMQVPITVLFEDDRYVHLKLWIDQPENIIELPLLPYKPKKIIFNTYDAVLCR